MLFLFTNQWSKRKALSGIKLIESGAPIRKKDYPAIASSMAPRTVSPRDPSKEKNEDL